jgi:hypothetical protein
MKVGRISTNPVTVKATVSGEETAVIIQELEVEMTCQSHGHSSMILRFSKPSEVEEAKIKFTKGQLVTFSF